AERVGIENELARQLLVEEREQQMLGVELGVALSARKLLRGRDGFLGLDRQLREIHAVLPSFRVPLAAVEHEVAAIFLVDPRDVFTQLLLQPVDLCLRSAQLVLEPQYELDAREV